MDKRQKKKFKIDDDIKTLYKKQEILDKGLATLTENQIMLREDNKVINNNQHKLEMEILEKADLDFLIKMLRIRDKEIDFLYILVIVLIAIGVIGWII